MRRGFRGFLDIVDPVEMRIIDLRDMDLLAAAFDRNGWPSASVTPLSRG
jgi:hypothetical protein